MRAGRLPEDHPEEQEARRRLRPKPRAVTPDKPARPKATYRGKKL